MEQLYTTGSEALRTEPTAAGLSHGDTTGSEAIRTNPTAAGVPHGDTTGPEAIRRVLDALEAARRVVVFSHEHPDGDAIGSSLGLAGFLRAAGRDAIAVVHGSLPDSAAFLAREAPALVRAEDFLPADGDVICIVDCHEASRVPAPLRRFVGATPLACIDHHIADSYPTEAVYAVPDASSTAELVWNVAQAAGWPLDRDIAEALWTGIVTDTGRFSYSSTRPSTLRCAADLLERGGVRTSFIADEAFHLISLRRLRLRGRMERSLEFFDGGRVALASLGPEDYAAEGATTADSENFVDVPRFVRGVETAVFLYSFRPGRTNMSMRTQPGLSAAEFCARFGGGGHARAAGATLDLPLVEARAAVKAALGV